jgi:hypothetical protein
VLRPKAGGPVILKSAAAEFDISPSGYLQAFLLKNGTWLTLDEPQAGITSSGDYLLSAGKEVRDFTSDFDQVKISDAQGMLGVRGQRVEIDGHKMDSIFTVPPCYNPKHRHRSPIDSIIDMAEVYRVIFQTTRALKPESVTQICPCGTTPNLA